MSGTERRYHRSVDELVLAATGKDLKRLQRIDLEAQKNGSTFYESFEENEHTFEHPSTVKKSKQI